MNNGIITAYFVKFFSLRDLILLHLLAVAYAGKISGGQGRGSVLVGGPGGAEPPPGRRKIFESLQKIPEANCKNCCIFAYFAKKLQIHALNICTFGRKTQLVGKILRKF